MRKLLSILLLSVSFNAYPVKDTLFVYYIENFPYSYTENGKIKGIEAEILEEYVKWEKTDGIDLTVEYKLYPEFDQMFKAVSEGKDNVIGLGSVTINEERLKYVSFSPPYIKNVSIMVSNTKAPTLQSKNEIGKLFKTFKAITLKSSVYEQFLLKIKKQYLKTLEFEYSDSEYDMLTKVAENENYFAYCDILSYWTYVEKTKNRQLKIQKEFKDDKDNLGLIIPKKSKHDGHLSEFFESGFGFISSKRYQEILNKYLSHEVIESVKMN